MSWIITGTQKLDPDAALYIDRVQVADNASLEPAVVTAINAFVVGCKADGIWNAIKASCILAGARTLSGALVPLAGIAPTNFNFVAGDYDRKTGLVGNGSTKYLNSNRNNNADPQNSNHNAVYVKSLNLVTTYTFIGAANPFYEVGANRIGVTGLGLTYGHSRNKSTYVSNKANVLGFYGINRSSSSNFTLRANDGNEAVLSASEAPSSRNVIVFGRAPNLALSSARIAFYSIGESLNLALLDSRVTTLINAFAAAIP